ncbi:MAG: hypothetical protein ACREEM_21175 [Blastocatellia bacterium]
MKSFRKIGEKIEDTLLQLFARDYAHVPRFGEIGIKTSPAGRS